MPSPLYLWVDERRYWHAQRWDNDACSWEAVGETLDDVLEQAEDDDLSLQSSDDD